MCSCLKTKKELLPNLDSQLAGDGHTITGAGPNFSQNGLMGLQEIL